MALPNQKRSKSRKKIKQFRHRLKKINLSVCPRCKKPIRPHHACLFCGTYNGKEVIKIKSKNKTKEERHKSKNIKEDLKDKK